ncbi:MAG: tetratricopeptide repeat protein [Cyanobacteria bacterium]|nr:tetratricopeptide repeat protein [Cyanobacteriota bacterium]
MSVALHQEKLVVICFYPATRPPEPGVLRLERNIQFGLITKLSLYSNIICKDLATKKSKLAIDLLSSHNRLHEELQHIATSHRARYVLSGSVLPVFGQPPSTLVEEVSLTLRLYDAHTQTVVLDIQHMLSQMENGRRNPENLAAMPDSYETAVNWAATELIKQITPHGDLSSLDDLASLRISRSYEAIQYLCEGDDPELALENRMKALEKATELDPMNELAHFNLGKLYKSLGNHRQSVQHYRKAFEVSRASGKVRALYATDAGICCALLGEYKPAIQWWDRAIDITPSYINPYMNIAHAYEEQEDYEQSEKYFLKAQAIAPKDIRTAYSLARIYSKIGEWTKALEQYKQQLAGDDSDPWCHSNIATCYLQLGDNSKAKLHLEKTAQLDPEGEAGLYAQLILTELV